MMAEQSVDVRVECLESSLAVLWVDWWVHRWVDCSVVDWAEHLDGILAASSAGLRVVDSVVQLAIC